MTRSVIDPVSRIEGHLRVEMQVENGQVSEAWVSGGLFRGMELILEGKEPADAAYIVQRICGVCPVSHSNAACFAGEAAMGIDGLPDGARLVRNIVEASQFLHSHILWFYNLNGIDYVDPMHALEADAASAHDLAQQVGTSSADFGAVQKHLQTFVDNGQLSIFSGNWFSRESYKLPAELDLIVTAHYLEALQYQAKASQISAIVGGKMPHIMTQIPGGTTFMPTAETLDDILWRAKEIRDWVHATMIPDALAIAPYYPDSFGYGKGVGRYIAWGVFNDSSQLPSARYLPAGVLDEHGALTSPVESRITEYTGHSFYASDTTLNPREGVTDPEYPEAGPDLAGKYTWSKAAAYDGKYYEAGSLSRMLVAYASGVPEVVSSMDSLTSSLGIQMSNLQSTFGRVAARGLETAYIADKLIDDIEELVEVVASGSAEFFVASEELDGEGAAMWEAPRGALYHFERLQGGRIKDYQIVIPTTWNISPRDAHGTPGPMEQALVGVPVADPEKPIDALRTVHSFDPCVACAVHVSEPATGKSFELAMNPWGVR